MDQFFERLGKFAAIGIAFFVTCGAVFLLFQMTLLGIISYERFKIQYGAQNECTVWRRY